MNTKTLSPTLPLNGEGEVDTKGGQKEDPQPCLGDFGIPRRRGKRIVREEEKTL
jgi:hypothetical protein